MNQHYVPQMYRRAWEVQVGQQQNQIYVYRINKPPVYWSITRKVGCLHDYYAFTDSGTGQFELDKAEN